MNINLHPSQSDPYHAQMGQTVVYRQVVFPSSSNFILFDSKWINMFEHPVDDLKTLMSGTTPKAAVSCSIICLCNFPQNIDNFLISVHKGP